MGFFFVRNICARLHNEYQAQFHNLTNKKVNWTLICYLNQDARCSVAAEIEQKKKYIHKVLFKCETVVRCILFLAMVHTTYFGTRKKIFRTPNR